MVKKFINEEVDIYKLPNPNLAEGEINGIQITIGDLHGNAVKLLFMLVKHGIATNISEKAYQRLVAIYRTPADKLKKECLKEFASILASMEFHSKSEVRLLGDELADRGSNDYFTLKILEKLNERRVPIEIIISNHSIEFIEAYEIQNNFKPQMLFGDMVDSMQKLQIFIDKDLVSREEILKIVNKAYRPVLKAISYSMDNNKEEITIYSHAGIGLNAIKSLAKKLNVEYKDLTIAELAQTIDEINIEFQKHVESNKIHTLYTRENMRKGFSSRAYADLSDETPFEFIMWNRNYSSIDRPAKHASYKLCFVHGHDPDDWMHNLNDPTERKAEHVFNLDNSLGKRKDFSQGTYTVLQTDIGMVTKKEETIVQELFQPKDSKISKILTTKHESPAPVEVIWNQGGDRRMLADEAENVSCPKVIVEATVHSPELASKPRTQDKFGSTFSRLMENLEKGTVETLHEHSDSPVNQSLRGYQIHTIKELLHNYLKYLSSYSIVISIGSIEQNVSLKEKDDHFIDRSQSRVSERFDETKRSKFNKTCELLIKLEKDHSAFLAEINSDDTKALLSEHRDNIAISMLKTIGYILTLGCVSRWGFFSSRGAQVIEGINDVLCVPRLDK